MNNTILIVDDEESLRLTLRLRLTAQGFNILLAEDGEAALEQLKTHKNIDLVLLDINMPKMDGIETLGHITQMYPNVEVMMLTGFADFSTAIECLKKGAKDYLVKPIEVTELVTRVRTTLRVRSSEQALKDLKSTFLSTFLHDMLSPLKTIESTVDQIKESTVGNLNDDHHVLLGYIGNVSERLLNRIKNVIDLSKFEEGKIVLEKHPLDLLMFLKTVCLRYEIIARSKKLQFKKELPASLPPVQCDFDRIDTVVNSLLDNAFKYSNEGGTVTLHVQPTTMQINGKPANGVQVEVRDEGVGISSEEIATIFNPYHGAAQKAVGDKQLTEYSLAIAKHIIDAHGGTITVESTPGKGSTFRFVLPL
ncbi:MAG: response regulator [Bacteroidota bacterium]